MHLSQPVVVELEASLAHVLVTLLFLLSAPFNFLLFPVLYPSSVLSLQGTALYDGAGFGSHFPGCNVYTSSYAYSGDEA